MNNTSYWPGTKTPKSQGNAFDLHTAGVLAKQLRLSDIKKAAGLKGAHAQQNRLPDGSAKKV